MAEVKPLSAEEIAELREAAREHFWADGPIEPESTNVLRLLDEVEAARALLKRIEWRGNVDWAEGPTCPACGSFFALARHLPDCALAALLR